MKARVTVHVIPMTDGSWGATIEVCSGLDCPAQLRSYSRGDQLSGISFAPKRMQLLRTYAVAQSPQEAASKAASEAAKALAFLRDNPIAADIVKSIPGVGNAIAAVLAGARMLDMVPDDVQSYAKSLGPKVGRKALRESKKLAKQIGGAAKSIGGALSSLF